MQQCLLTLDFPPKENESHNPSQCQIPAHPYHSPWGSSLNGEGVELQYTSACGKRILRKIFFFLSFVQKHNLGWARACIEKLQLVKLESGTLVPRAELQATHRAQSHSRRWLVQ